MNDTLSLNGTHCLDCTSLESASRFARFNLALCGVFKRKAASFRCHLHLLRIMFVVVVVSSTPVLTYSNERMIEAQARKQRYACGARAAFVLIRMLGRDVTYSTVCDHVPPSEQGCSLEDVQNALLAHDVQCAILRLQLTDLSSVPCPFILHTQPPDSFPVPPTGDPPLGHFVLVTEVDQVGLHTYDPVTSLKRHWRWLSLADQWGGYAIVPTRATIRNDQTLLSYLLGIHLLVAACVVAALRRKTWGHFVHRAGMRYFFIVAVLLTYGLLHPVGAVAEERLRSNLNDGANAAALLGGIFGVEIPPGHAGGTDPVDSLRDIQLRLQAYGVTTSVRLLSYQELASCNLPCVVPLRFVNTEKTSFCVFVQANESDVHLVEAGPLIVRTMSVDNFRRYWTGYAVLGNVADTHYRDLSGWALFGIGLPLSGYGLYTYVCRRRRLSI